MSADVNNSRWDSVYNGIENGCSVISSIPIVGNVIAGPVGGVSKVAVGTIQLFSGIVMGLMSEPQRTKDIAWTLFKQGSAHSLVGGLIEGIPFIGTALFAGKFLSTNLKINEVSGTEASESVN